MKTFHIAATGEQPLLKLDFQMERWVYNRDIVGNVMTEAFVWGENGYLEIYYSDSDSEGPIYEDGKKLLNPDTAHRIIGEIRQIEKDFWKVAWRFRNEFNKEISTQKLLELFEAFHLVSRKMHAYFMTSREEPMAAIEERLKELVQSAYGEEFVAPYILLTTPTEKDLLFYEKQDFLAVCEDPSDEKIKAHALKYPFLLFNVESEADAIAVLRARMTPEDVTKIRHEVNSFDQEKESIKRQQETILSKLPQEARDHAWFIQEASVTRLLLKNCWGGTSYFLLPFFSYLAERAGVSVGDAILFTTISEIVQIIKTGKWISPEELVKRKSAYFFYFKDGKVMLYSGDDARRMKKEIFDPTHSQEIKEFKGTIANKGIVRGKVKIIKVDSLKDIQKVAPELTKEHILVTGMTNPTMMILVRKVAGIITDEGGMACHAAIISREFNLPCIVGCRIATQVLHDGDLIELNADTGTVQILERMA